jgi:hypothetical protein
MKLQEYTSMKWLFNVDVEGDLITVCRLMNIFRRKGIELSRLGTASKGDSFSLVALFDAQETEIDHVFHFLRRTEGVSRVECYRQGKAEEASLILVDGNSDRLDVARWAEVMRGSKLVFASHGQALLEVAPGSAASLFAAYSGSPQPLAFTCVKQGSRG